MKIKFSHNYPKLHYQKYAQLLGVVLENRDRLSDKFIEYDTIYTVEPAIGVCSEAVTDHFPLPPGKYMVLVFLGNEHIPFTTVRRWTPEKEEYYRSNISKIFDIEIVEGFERSGK